MRIKVIAKNHFQPLKLLFKSSKYLHGSIFHLHVIFMLFVCIHILSICTRYDIRMSVVCTVPICYPFVFRVYWYIIRISLACTRTSSMCRSYVILYHPCIIRIYLYVCHSYVLCVICMSLVCDSSIILSRVSLIQLASMNSFYSCDKCKTSFTRICRYPEVWWNRHVFLFFERNIMKEVPILYPISVQ